MYAPVAVAHPRLADLLDPLLQSGLLAAPGLVGVEGTVDAQGLGFSAGKAALIRQNEYLV